MKMYDIVEDYKGDLFMVDSFIEGKHGAEVCCLRLRDKMYFTAPVDDWTLWVNAENEIGGMLCRE